MELALKVWCTFAQSVSGTLLLRVVAHERILGRFIDQPVLSVLCLSRGPPALLATFHCCRWAFMFSRVNILWLGAQLVI